jgi:hypothetical protein
MLIQDFYKKKTVYKKLGTRYQQKAKLRNCAFGTDFGCQAPSKDKMGILYVWKVKRTIERESQKHILWDSLLHLYLFFNV